jgi:hypothetical protein
MRGGGGGACVHHPRLRLCQRGGVLRYWRGTYVRFIRGSVGVLRVRLRACLYCHALMVEWIVWAL